VKQLIRYRKREKEFKGKIKILFAVILVLFAIVFFRLLYINFFEEKVLKGAKDSVKIINVQNYRGSILDRNGVPLAISYPVGYIYVYKFFLFSDEKKKEQFIKGLSRILKIPQEEIRKKLSKNKDVFELITFPLEKAEEIRNFIRRIDYDKDKKMYTKPFITAHVGVGQKYLRFYPHKYFASNLIGFVKKEGGGGEGLEYQFDRYLTGHEEKGKKIILYRDKGILFIEPKDYGFYEPKDLVLSLDYRVQSVIEEIKKKIRRKWKPKKIVIIVMESDTGKIRGFTTFPDYDPNRYERFFPIFTRNFGTYDLFEIGSTFKPFLVAYAVDKGFIKKNSLIDINYGKLRVYKKIIRDPIKYLRKKKYITPAEVLIYSSNVGAIKIGMRLSPEDFDKLFSTFRMKKTPKIIFSENNPQISDLHNKVNKAYASIGQGIAYNALHLLTSFNALIQGKYVKPSILEKEEVQTEPLDISPSTVIWLRSILIQVVEKGTGKNAKSDLFYIGGKTGTAQKYDRKIKTYSKEKLTTFFIGFFPKSPKFTAIILVDEPKGKNIYGGKVAAPYFKELAERIASIYGLKPDKK